MPQTRGELTPAQKQRIAAALHGVEAADKERDESIAAALKAGASVREIATFTGMSGTTIQKIGHSHGWPTETQRRRREEQREARQQWRRLLGEDDS